MHDLPRTGWFEGGVISGDGDLRKTTEPSLTIIITLNEEEHSLHISLSCGGEVRGGRGVEREGDRGEGGERDREKGRGRGAGEGEKCEREGRGREREREQREEGERGIDSD